jgi:putative hemolysin
VWHFEWLVIPAMILLNGVLAAYEIALAVVSVFRLQTLMRENRTGARAAWHMKENMEASLATVQLGITVVGAIAAATGGAAAEEGIAPFFERLGWSAGWADVAAITIVVLPLSFATIVIGELIPKVFALRNKEWVCLQLSPIMRWFALGAWPAVWLFESLVTRVMSWGERRWQARLDRVAKSEASELQELRAIAALARTARLISGREEKIIVQAARLSRRPVCEIMLPPEHITMLPLDASMAEALVAAHLEMHTRFPVCERLGEPQSVVGYVNFKDIVLQLRLSPQEPSLRGILRPIPNLSDSVPISAALERLMRERTHIALVRDDHHRVVGMITLEDIVEELMGEIEDEFDRLPAHVSTSGGGWVMGGGVSVTRIAELTGVDLTVDSPTRARTLHEWLSGHLGRPIRGGDVIERSGLRVLVRKARRQKLFEALVGRTGSPATPATPGADAPSPT